jgi:hypothetical protein
MRQRAATVTMSRVCATVGMVPGDIRTLWVLYVAYHCKNWTDPEILFVRYTFPTICAIDSEPYLEGSLYRS